MQRVTISLDEALAGEFDRLARERGYQSRSEGVRDLVRDAVESWRGRQTGDAACVANLSYVYNRRIRNLPQRLSDLQHEAHDLVVATSQMILDHDHTLETVLLRGRAAAVRAFADTVCAERGVRSGALNLIAVVLSDAHSHPGAHSHDGHAHMSPRPG